MPEAADDDLPLAFPVSPEARLRLALRGLDGALAAQRQALGTLRASLAELQTATGGLGGALAEYRNVMADTAAATSCATAAAKTLEQTADRMLALPATE